MEEMVAGGLGLLLACAVLASASSTEAAPAALQGSFPLVELRQYTLREGRRDELIELFEREFVESQEAEGMKVIGTFTDLDNPDRFVWLRGYPDMEKRRAGLSAFYGGPIWKAHRDAANATMIDSDNVLLLRSAGDGAAFFSSGRRPGLGQHAPAGLIVATVYYLDASPVEALSVFERHVMPSLAKAGIRPIAWFTPETAPNNFPRLPVREGEKLLVWFTAFTDADDHAAHGKALTDAEAPLQPLSARAPEVLRLKPTARSLLRGISREAPKR